MARRARTPASSEPRPAVADPVGARAVAVERPSQQQPAGSGVEPASDWVAVEEPFEIRVEGRPFAITLRTPGHDRELTLGFLLAEGVIESARDVETLELAPGADGAEVRGDRALVKLRADALDRWARRKVERELRVTSACGACGKPALEDLWRGTDARVSPLRFDASLAPALLREMRARQVLFERTGGLHAAAAFDVEGECLGVYEDVGRHNAVDKLVGSRARTPRPLADAILVVSGRVGFEIAQKAAMAGAPVVVAVGAASSLAVELASSAGIELWCFAGSAGMHRHPPAR